jgi:Lrp/AsnC family transcriptional regulator, regulator for asnA, asnC and gidA
MKDIGLKLLAELMKNSKTSDRELATKLGVSQPTVSRIRAKLEKEGYIKEYTLIPDFQKLGFEIMAVTLVKLKRELKKGELEKIWEFADELLEKSPFAYVMALDGYGLGYNRVVISLHENYSDFVRFVKATREVPYAELAAFDSFIISLSSKHYQPMTFSIIAKYLLAMKKKTID